MSQRRNLLRRAPLDFVCDSDVYSTESLLPAPLAEIRLRYGRMRSPCPALLQIWGLLFGCPTRPNARKNRPGEGGGANWDAPSARVCRNPWALPSCSNLDLLDVQWGNRLSTNLYFVYFGHLPSGGLLGWLIACWLHAWWVGPQGR